MCDAVADDLAEILRAQAVLRGLVRLEAVRLFMLLVYSLCKAPIEVVHSYPAFRKVGRAGESSRGHEGGGDGFGEHFDVLRWINE